MILGAFNDGSHKSTNHALMQKLDLFITLTGL